MEIRDNVVEGAFTNFHDQLLGGAYLALPLGLVALILAPAYISIGIVVMLFLNGKMTGLRCSPNWYRRRRNDLQSRIAFEDVKGELRMTRLDLMAWWGMGLLCWPPILLLMFIETLYGLVKRCHERTLQCRGNVQASRHVEEVNTQEIDA